MCDLGALYRVCLNSLVMNFSVVLDVNSQMCVNVSLHVNFSVVLDVKCMCLLTEIVATSCEKWGKILSKNKAKFCRNFCKML